MTYGLRIDTVRKSVVILAGADDETVAMKHPCKYPGCGQLLAKSGYCAMHQGSKPNAQRNYDRTRRKNKPELALAARIRASVRWKKVAKMKLGMNPMCEDPHGTHERRNDTATAKQVHHIEGLAIAPEKAFDLCNLMSVCTSCHARLERDERSKPDDERMRPERSSHDSGPCFG
jgi:hypothetical protein